MQCSDKENRVHPHLHRTRRAPFRPYNIPRVERTPAKCHKVLRYHKCKSTEYSARAEFFSPAPPAKGSINFTNKHTTTPASFQTGSLHTLVRTQTSESKHLAYTNTYVFQKLKLHSTRALYHWIWSPRCASSSICSKNCAGAISTGVLPISIWHSQM